MLESIINGEKPFAVGENTSLKTENNRERETAFDIKSGKHAWAESNKEEAPRPISPPLCRGRVKDTTLDLTDFFLTLVFEGGGSGGGAMPFLSWSCFGNSGLRGSGVWL